MRKGDSVLYKYPAIYTLRIPYSAIQLRCWFESLPKNGTAVQPSSQGRTVLCWTLMRRHRKSHPSTRRLSWLTSGCLTQPNRVCPHADRVLHSCAYYQQVRMVNYGWTGANLSDVLKNRNQPCLGARRFKHLL